MELQKNNDRNGMERMNDVFRCRGATNRRWTTPFAHSSRQMASKYHDYYSYIYNNYIQNNKLREIMILRLHAASLGSNNDNIDISI